MLRALSVILFTVILLPFTGMATHNRAGEITYRHISGFEYEITVVTYTNDLSVAADRCFLEVKFGDGQIADVYRTNGTSCTGGQNFCTHCGTILPNSQNVKVNIYKTTHTYPSTGKYIISMLDPNRNAGVINIPQSVQVPFYLYSELNIFPDGVPNSSPVLSNPPIDDACLRVLYEHNPGAIDYDITINGKSDSLSYKLVICRGAGGSEIPGYSYPDVWPSSSSNNNISIDSVTGTLSWDSPQLVGVYNVAILIEEWRHIGKSVVKMGSILRDLQITVDNCDKNNPPKIGKVSDTCITAGQFLARKITAVDNEFLPNNTPQTVTLSATGDPFYVIGNKASFAKKSAQITVSQNFTWSTQCQHIRAYPYFVVFRAEDNHPDVHLTDYQDWRIKVLGPPPENINAEAIGAGINVTWSYTKCTNATGFRIYRKMDSIGYIAPHCETGIPASTGYQFIGSTTGPASTTFFDNEGGVGLISGQRYCYMVYAYFDDGAESYPSFEACATLRKEVPIITRVSVNNTDLSTGSDTIKWAKPTELNMIKHPGPYQYKILRKEPGVDYVEVGSSSINPDLNLIDTIFVDNGLNTQEIQYTYRIQLFGNGDTIGPSRPATSPWLKAKPLDNRLELSLNIDVPWVNQTMYVYRQKADLTFAYLDSSNSSIIFTDSNLVNGVEYCYYITTKGGYSDPGLEFPLLNNSQILCAIPEDKQAPCPPQDFKVNSDCELFFNDLSWLNPNVTCDTTDDVVSYNIYYRPFSEGEMTVIKKIDGDQNTTHLFADLESVAGCYAVTAIDSFNNESPMSDTICVDNCPVYELPNIITPGGDGQNDTFIPHYGWRYVKEVEMHIYNRWGEEVYFTTNPALGWDGTTKTGDLLPNGTYFYVCTVFEIRLEGIIERNLKGTVTLLREEPGKPNN